MQAKRALVRLSKTVGLALVGVGRESAHIRSWIRRVSLDSDGKAE